jgi:hypothetical protein
VVRETFALESETIEGREFVIETDMVVELDGRGLIEIGEGVVIVAGDGGGDDDNGGDGGDVGRAVGSNTE